jgi:hypothetical protein
MESEHKHNSSLMYDLHARNRDLQKRQRFRAKQKGIPLLISSEMIQMGQMSFRCPALTV